MLGKNTIRVLFSDGPRMPQVKGFGGRKTGGSQTPLSLQSSLFFSSFGPFSAILRSSHVPEDEVAISAQRSYRYAENV